MRKIVGIISIWAGLCLALAFAVQLAWADPGPARLTAEQSASKILSLLNDPAFKDPATKPEIQAKIEAEILHLFDFEEFSSRTIGPNWRNFTPDQKLRFQKAFTELIRNSYIGALDSYGGEQINFTGELSSDGGSRVEIQMDFLAKGKAYPVAFRLLVKDDRWVVYDVNIEGISMIRNYRDQFRDILVNGSAEVLISRVEAKAAEEAAK